MDVQVLTIERNDTKIHGRHEAVYDVTIAIDSMVRTFEVLVGTRRVGADPVRYATFRDPDELRIFARDHRPITEILRRVTAVHHHEPAAFPASTLARH